MSCNVINQPEDNLYDYHNVAVRREHPFHTEQLIRIETQINVGYCVHTRV